MKDIKYIDIEEFRKFGYLQELNRQFLHPLGLALEVYIDEDGNEKLGRVWDYRKDPEGIRFGKESKEVSERRIGNSKRVLRELKAKKIEREKKLGYFIQPVEEL